MKRRIFLCILIFSMLTIPVQAEPIRWVDFNVPYESLKYAMNVDIETFDQEKHIGWIDALALAACRTGGQCGIKAVRRAVQDLQGDKSPEELLGSLYKYYSYYHAA